MHLIITGATTGIGFETVKALYASCVKVILTYRDMNKGLVALNKIEKLVALAV
jgi:NADP-dependent 3-hydroxy acid dehydrogenase YdfG